MLALDLLFLVSLWNEQKEDIHQVTSISNILHCGIIILTNKRSNLLTLYKK